MPATRKDSGVKVLDKALDILETVGASEKGLSLTEVVTDLSIPQGTAHRLLQQLVDRGYLEQDSATKHYFLGLQVMALRSQVIYVWQIASRARPYLRDLMLATECLVHLAVYRDGHVVYIDRVDTSESVARFIPAGHRLPAYCTALGKVFLANLSPRELDHYLSNTELKPITPYTLIDPKKLVENIRQINERGYGLDIQEVSLGNWCVATAVRDYSGRTVAAISIATKDVSKADHLNELAPIVIDTAAQISKGLGFNTGFNQGRTSMEIF